MHLLNPVGYDDSVAWLETVHAALLHGDTLTPEDREQRRRRRRHHTVPIYILRLFSTKGEFLQAFDQETRRPFRAVPRRLLCEAGANTVVGPDGVLRSDVEGVFAYTDSMLSKSLKQIVKAMRSRRNQLLDQQRVPDLIDISVVEADAWELAAVGFWCSQRKRNPRNPDFRHLSSKLWAGSSPGIPDLLSRMLFNVWRATLDRGAIDELMAQRELTVGVSLGHDFVVGDELANFVQTPGDLNCTDTVPVIPVAREVCLLWRRRSAGQSSRTLRFEWLDDSFVDAVNAVTTARSRVIAGPSRAQLLRLVMANP